MITLIQAISSLKPTSGFAIRQDESIVWHDTEQTEPSRAEIDAEVIRLQAVYDAQEYARKRKAKYDLLNQDEMRFDDLINSTTTWKDAILAIKSEFPKP